MSSDISDYAEKNRAAWNEVMPIHREGRKVDLREEVRRESFNVLGDVEREAFGRIGIAGREVAQLCCNNGRELISLLRMGAAHGVGFDISDAAIDEARLLSELAQVHADFVRTNVLDIGAEWDAQFDVVFISVGALTWIHDLRPFFGVVGRLLRAGGHLFLHEAHPFTDMMATTDDPEYDPTDELKILFSYFRSEPWISDTGLDYVGGTTYASKPSICFSHPLSEIITGIAQNSMVIEEFREYPGDIANVFAHLQKYGKVPLSYSLLASKVGAALGA